MANKGVGLMGYARDFNGVQTPELFMQVKGGIGEEPRLLTYEESLTFERNSLASFFGKVADVTSSTAADKLVVEGTWRPSGDDEIFLTSPREVFLGDNVGAAFVGDAERVAEADDGVAHDRTAAWPEEPRVEALIRDFLVERLAENLGGAAHVAPFVAGFLHPSRWADDERAA